MLGSSGSVMADIPERWIISPILVQTLLRLLCLFVLLGCSVPVPFARTCSVAPVVVPTWTSVFGRCVESSDGAASCAGK